MSSKQKMVLNENMGLHEGMMSTGNDKQHGLIYEF